MGDLGPFRSYGDMYLGKKGHVFWVLWGPGLLGPERRDLA